MILIITEHGVEVGDREAMAAHGLKEDFSIGEVMRIKARQESQSCVRRSDGGRTCAIGEVWAS